MGEVRFDVELGSEGVRFIEPHPQIHKTETAKNKFPNFIISISLLQGLVFYYGGRTAWLIFAVDPFRRYEIWRYLTSMLGHVSSIHLWSNLVLQLILGVILETVHHWKRVSLIYMFGVVGGSVAITIGDPKRYGMGASGGVYALFAAHLATIIINWHQMRRKCCRIFWLLAYTVFDIGLNLFIEYYLNVPTNSSHGGHLGGALAGFLASSFLLKNFEPRGWELRFRNICVCLMCLLGLTVCVINIAFPHRYFKTEWNMNYERTMTIYTIQLVHQSEPDSELRESCHKDPFCQFALQQYSNGTLTFQL